MKKTFYSALLGCLIAAGCSSDDDMPPAPKPEPRVFDTSVIHGTKGLIACADINHDPNSNYLSFFKSIKGDCPSSDELYLPGGNDSEYIRVYYDGGLKINMSFNVKAKQKKLDDLEEVRFYIVKFDNYEKAERVHVVDIWNNKNATWNYRAEIDDFHVEADKSLKKQGKDLEVEFPVKNGEVIRVSFLGVIKKGDLFEDYTITGSASFYELSTPSP